MTSATVRQVDRAAGHGAGRLPRWPRDYCDGDAYRTHAVAFVTGDISLPDDSTLGRRWSDRTAVEKDL